MAEPDRGAFNIFNTALRFFLGCTAFALSIHLRSTLRVRCRVGAAAVVDRVCIGLLWVAPLSLTFFSLFLLVFLLFRLAVCLHDMNTAGVHRDGDEHVRVRPAAPPRARPLPGHAGRGEGE